MDLVYPFSASQMATVCKITASLKDMDTDTIMIQNISNTNKTPPIAPLLPYSRLSSPRPQALLLVTTNLCSISLIFVISRMSCKGNHTVCKIWGLTFSFNIFLWRFTQFAVCTIVPFSSWLLHDMNVLQFAYPFTVKGHPGFL